ncbi:Exosome complex component rrp4 [Diaporthe eres]|uniref:Exosome complex component rrp4 n=1 Tax=Diaporthe eres TaxID=83184 RepID=A0ABR1NW67_DIAER
MAGEKTPSNQPEKLSDILKQEKRDYDCTPCTAFLGLAGYSYISGMSQLEKQRAVILKSNSWLGMRGRKMGIGGLSLGLAYLGLYRLFA